METKKLQRAKRRKKRTRGKILNQKSQPRLSVFRSNLHIYAQIIDDQKENTLVSASDQEIDDKGKNKIEKARLVGEILAKKAKTKKITRVIFDRGAYKYHGRIKALADEARKGGLIF